MTLKSHNRNRWLIPSKSDGCSFIHDYYNLIQEYNSKEEKSREIFLKKEEVLCKYFHNLIQHVNNE